MQVHNGNDAAIVTADKLGEPPDPYKSIPNPAFEAWVEHAAIVLCLDSHEDEVPRPCLDVCTKHGLARLRRDRVSVQEGEK